MQKELLIKYLNNECTDAEINEIFNWLQSEGLTEDGKEWSLEVWNSVRYPEDLEEDEKFSMIFDKIQERIDTNMHSSQLKILPIVYKWFMKAAAVLLIPVLGLLFYTLSERNYGSGRFASLVADSIEIVAPIGSKAVIQLSDGSEVQLNYGSKIKYPHFFSGNTRDISLTGEAFFKVAHNPEKPFIVKAGKLNVKAVGTSFNVLAYPDNEMIETTLVTGKVILEKTKLNGTFETIATMDPGLHINYNTQTGSIAGMDRNIEKYIAWTKGQLTFEDTPIVDVINKLSRMYNVDFEIEDNIKHYNYTVTFTDEPLYQILDLMSIATPIKYQILPRKKLQDGTYSKQKIILRKRE